MQFAWAFMLMSIIPLVIAIFLIFIVDASTIEGRIEQASIAVFWMFISSVAGYFIIRKSVMTISGLTEHVKEVVNGNISKIELLNEDNEIGELARYFDDVAKKLEVKIKELEISKKLIQGIFHKIGEATTSSRGIDSLLELILQSISGATGARGGFIMLVDKDASDIKPLVVYSEDNQNPKLSPVKINDAKGAIARAFREDKPIVASQDDIWANNFDVKSLLCMPLDYKNNVIGIIAIYDKKHGLSFSTDDLILFKDVASQTAMAIANFQLNADIEKAYLDTIKALAMAVEAKDPYSGGHLDRVAGYATNIGNKLGLLQEDIKGLHDGSYLHDLGKIGIRDDILQKNGKLTPEEFEEMKKHAAIGETIIKPIKSLSKLSSIVRSHQERWDGSGYPDGLKGEQIPLHARILAVADVYDALITERSYKKAMTKEEAKAELQKLAGVKLDKKIVAAFLETI